MTARQRAGLAAATFAVATMLACGDPNAPQASFPNYADTLTLYALNGAPRGAPTAIRIVAGIFGGSAAVTTEPAFQFDLAVDLDDEGRPRLYPLRTIASPILEPVTHPVGILRAMRPFDDITEAPENGYVRDTATTVAIGESLVIESGDRGACGNLFGGVIYAKIVIDSVRTATREIFLRIAADPNCGFRSLVVPGVPTD
jgi:hypothetical protein